MSDERYIWVRDWRKFQHYKPDPGRGPAWIKTYTAQLDDSRYLDLTDRQRALLHDLRMMFGAYRVRLVYDAPAVARRRNSRTRYDDLEALNHAGFIEVISRETLELRLDELYSRSRAEVEKEVEKKEPVPAPEPEVEVPSTDIDFRPNGAGAGDLKRIDPHALLEELMP